MTTGDAGKNLRPLILLQEDTMSEQIALTASNLRYLLAIRELNRDNSGIRCVDIAAVLGLSKPSVHSMMNSFRKMELVQKDRYGKVYLTPKGADTAERYSVYYKAVYAFLTSRLPETPGMQTLVCSLLAETPEESLFRLLYVPTQNS